MPERHGPWQALGQRVRRWSADETWERLLAHVQVHDDAIGAVDLTTDQLERPSATSSTADLPQSNDLP
ncbi:hypothetical protein BKA00_002485 [Actinomadura coerulea]|uniref:Transposase n=2 Tax=Actinomadura coerulea TaxID=46159 RepID=A0A7X0FXJ6_9ACTN|nr:hypothetical protein [Actinomadura coerulea]